jgi:hypothetical protein
LPPGQEREKLLKKVRETDGAAQIDDSPGLRPPK